MSNISDTPVGLPAAGDAGRILRERLGNRRLGWLDIRSTLLHFALINYAVPVDRLRPHIPDRFAIVPFTFSGRACGVLSVVPFLDADFRFVRLAPFLRFRFGQTNHRVYVVDRCTGEHAVWFFGTTLGSRVVHAARTLWRIPWHYAKYDFDCEFDEDERRYRRYGLRIQSDWCAGVVELEDTGEPVREVEGFEAPEQIACVLTHPVEGFFYRLDRRLGTYSVWHEQMSMTVARPRQLYFSLYEQLGLMSRDEMSRPHSIFLCPDIEFDVHMPPKVLRTGGPEP